MGRIMFIRREGTFEERASARDILDGRTGEKHSEQSVKGAGIWEIL